MDGIIVVNKQKGCTSHDVLNKVKKIVNKGDIDYLRQMIILK